MPQMVLPLFSAGVKEITSMVGYENREGQIRYYLGQLPLYIHEADDVASFRYITSQLHISGHVTQSEIVKAFGVTTISVKRSVKVLREKGMAGKHHRHPILDHRLDPGARRAVDAEAEMRDWR